MPSDDETRLDRPFDGRYRLRGRLGAGGMATVYLAEDETLGRKVALKVLAERFAEDDQFVERFRREAQSAARLNHPSIVAIYDRGHAEGTWYIAMEYVEGRTLKDVVLDEGPLPAERATDFALQILSALRFAHEHGVVHRDIKPQNVLVTPDGRAKVADFGIARAEESQMTEAGSIVGTAQYISPEQARGLTVGPPADVYSVGVVLYEMLTARVPFEADSAVAVAMKHVSEPAPPPRGLVPSIPVPLEQVVMRALAKDPARRYPSALEMATDLERVRRGLGPTAETQQLSALRTAQATEALPAAPERTAVWQSPPTAAPPVAPPPRPVAQRRSRWPWVLALLLLAAAGGIAAYALGAVGGSSGRGTTSSTAPIAMPAVVGEPYAQAKAKLEALGLSLLVARQPVKSTSPAEQVVESEPVAGSPLVTGGRVVLKTSRGTQVMPSVVGLLEQDATARLRQLGFVVTAPQSVPSNVPAGQVTDQSVPKGTEWPVSGSVTLTLSSGPPLKAVPDVRFQYTPDQAKAVLANAGFKLGNQGSEYSGSVAQGNIIRQNPAAGAQAPAGTAVTVVVSLGSPNVSVPDVSTMTQSAATSTLTNGGLRIVIGTPVAVSDPAQDGIVQQQSPTAGQRVKRGSPVTVNLGQYTAPATTATTATTSTTPTTP